MRCAGLHSLCRAAGSRAATPHGAPAVPLWLHAGQHLQLPDGYKGYLVAEADAAPAAISHHLGGSRGCAQRAASGARAPAHPRGTLTRSSSTRAPLPARTLWLAEGDEECAHGEACAGAPRRATRQWQARAAFGGLTYWNHDTPPARADLPRRVFDWMAVAAQVRAAWGVCGPTGEV